MYFHTLYRQLTIVHRNAKSFSVSTGPCLPVHWNANSENKDYVSRIRQTGALDIPYPRDLTFVLSSHEQCIGVII